MDNYSMVQECTDAYHVERHPDDRITIRIDVPRRFASLWIMTLSKLRTTEEEIAAHEHKHIQFE